MIIDRRAAGVNHQVENHAITMLGSQYFFTPGNGDFGHGPFTNICVVVKDGIDPLSGHILGFRPILITILTTFVGLMPVIADTIIQAQFLIPIALSIAFGILLSNFLILLLVPACLAVAPKAKAAISAK